MNKGTVLQLVSQGEIVLERIDIFIERLAASVGRAAGGARFLAFEAFLDGDVAGLAEFVYLHAEVAGRGAASSPPMGIDITASLSSECSRGFSFLNISYLFIILAMTPPAVIMMPQKSHIRQICAPA